MVMYMIWAGIIVIFAVLEAATAQLVSIWFVFGAVAAFVCALFDLSILIQAIVFIAVTVAALLVTRPLLRKYLHPKAEKTNADRCIGQNAVVVERIDNLAASGQVKVGGNIWSARTADNNPAEVNEIVTVEKIEGVKLIVAKQNIN